MIDRRPALIARCAGAADVIRAVRFATSVGINSTTGIAGLPEGALQSTVALYNEHAARGADPLFHKAQQWLTPLDQPPYALVSYELDKIVPAAV